MDALRLIASKTPCAALRHAFIHLALARAEGGELILPLRELSDSTQLHFQDAVEEEIAKMPVRATAPLVCVFAGLMVCFMTIPVLQVISVTERAQNSTMQEPGEQR